MNTWISGYPTGLVWSDIHAHGYFRRRGTMRLMDLDLDLVLQYPSKPAPLPSLSAMRGIVTDMPSRDPQL
jgi:hypothetical protein